MNNIYIPWSSSEFWVKNTDQTTKLQQKESSDSKNVFFTNKAKSALAWVMLFFMTAATSFAQWDKTSFTWLPLYLALQEIEAMDLDSREDSVKLVALRNEFVDLQQKFDSLLLWVQNSDLVLIDSVAQKIEWQEIVQKQVHQDLSENFDNIIAKLDAIMRRETVEHQDILNFYSYVSSLGNNSDVALNKKLFIEQRNTIWDKDRSILTDKALKRLTALYEKIETLDFSKLSEREKKSILQEIEWTAMQLLAISD